MFYGGGVSVVCAMGMVVLGKYVIGILFGERYLEAIEYLPSVCMFVVPLTFITILMNYLLAVNRAKVFDALIAIGVGAIVMGSYFIHDSIQSLMNFVGIILCLVFILSVVSLVVRKRINDKV